MTPADYRAFTVSSNNGLLREINAPVKVALADALAIMFKLETPPADVMSLWDTGATATSISKRLATQLQLPPISKTRISCAGQPYESSVYMVDLHLPSGVTVRNVKEQNLRTTTDSTCWSAWISSPGETLPLPMPAAEPSVHSGCLRGSIMSIMLANPSIKSRLRRL